MSNETCENLQVQRSAWEKWICIQTHNCFPTGLFKFTIIKTEQNFKKLVVKMSILSVFLGTCSVRTVLNTDHDILYPLLCKILL